jgi:hypothetical protein
MAPANRVVIAQVPSGVGQGGPGRAGGREPLPARAATPPVSQISGDGRRKAAGQPWANVALNLHLDLSSLGICAHANSANDAVK